MPSSLPADAAEHPFFDALSALLGIGLRHYLVKGVHTELAHGGDADACEECRLLLRGLDTQSQEVRERLFGSMRDFADRFGY